MPVRFKSVLMLILGGLVAVPVSAGTNYRPHRIYQKQRSSGTSGGGGTGCSGHAKGYPPGWTFSAVFQYNTTVNSICVAYLYQPDGVLDECLGDGDCTMLCQNNID